MASVFVGACGHSAPKSVPAGPMRHPGKPGRVGVTDAAEFDVDPGGGSRCWRPELTTKEAEAPSPKRPPPPPSQPGGTAPPGPAHKLSKRCFVVMQE